MRALKKRRLDLDECAVAESAVIRGELGTQQGPEKSTASNFEFLASGNAVEQTLLRKAGPQQKRPHHITSQHDSTPTLNRPSYPAVSGKVPGVAHVLQNAAHPQESAQSLVPSTTPHYDSASVCFGMFIVSELRVLPKQTAESSLNCFSVEVRSGSIHTTSSSTGGFSGSKIGHIICHRSTALIRRLEEGRDVQLEFFCRGINLAVQHGRSSKGQFRKLELLVNVFGQAELTDAFGKFFEKLGICLQDPVICHRDVPYRNPHLLAQDDSEVTTSSFKEIPETERFVAPADVFDELLQTGNMPEAESPSKLRTHLLSHQKQALYFMLCSEKVCRIGTSPHHMWNESTVLGQEFTNVITGSCQSLRPKDFYGGLIADHMGLGKTLQVISLLASDRDPNSRQAVATDLSSAPASMDHPLSLVIMPASLLQTWHDQMTEHLKPDTLRWHIYHGSGRRNIWEVISNVQVVMTTYDVVAFEYRNILRSDAAFSSTPIFSRTWTRVILDEAHLIRNTAALRTKAVCAIQPEQDLSALLQFLQVAPFDDPTIFDEHIVKPWKTRSDPKAVEKLRKLIKAVAIRRSKKLLGLPARDDQIHHVEFNEDERTQYEKSRLRIRDAAFDSDDANICAHILRWMDDLRGLCSHGGQLMRTSRSSVPLPSTRKAGPPLQTSTMVDFDQVGSLLGDDILVTTNREMEIVGSVNQSDMLADGVSDCQEPSRCWRSSYKGPYQWPSNHFLRPPDATGCNSPSLESPISPDHAPVYSSKVSALLSDISKHDGKAVVFSFSRTTLDMVSRCFEDCGLRFVRIDGTVPNRERDSTLNAFRSDASIKVLLATVSAAGVGLDITVANLACLLEPQWNPLTEEQALSRVHRMRQTKPVKTIRYVVRNTIEENIIELQQRKLRLAQLALSGEGEAVGKGLMDDLKMLLK